MTKICFEFPVIDHPLRSRFHDFIYSLPQGGWREPTFHHTRLRRDLPGLSALALSFSPPRLPPLIVLLCCLAETRRIRSRLFPCHQRSDWWEIPVIIKTRIILVRVIVISKSLVLSARSSTSRKRRYRRVFFAFRCLCQNCFQLCGDTVHPSYHENTAESRTLQCVLRCPVRYWPNPLFWLRLLHNGHIYA